MLISRDTLRKDIYNETFRERQHPRPVDISEAQTSSVEHAKIRRAWAYKSSTCFLVCAPLYEISG